MHIEGLPVGYYTKEVGRKIASRFGDPEEIQIPERMKEEGGGRAGGEERVLFFAFRQRLIC